MRIATLVALVLAFGASRAFLQRQEFPHNDHATLFPLCQGCHLGIATNDSAALFPEPALCGRCHDGVQTDRVEWTGPAPAIDNLRFDHDAHTKALADSLTLDCENCHSPPDSGRMVVERSVVANCLGCHAHRASEHIVDGACATCHIPLAETEFPVERILELPVPPDHESDRFLPETHGPLAKQSVASCSTCHTRERCTSCHVNAATLPAIVQVPAAGPALATPRFAARYPPPTTHQSRGWIEDHPEVASVQSCSTCHTRDDCQTCHRASLPAVVAALPARRDVEAPGVTTLLAVVPPSHADPGFAKDHGPLAATTLAACTTCHTRESCADCHDRTALSDATLTDAPGSTMPPPVADTLERAARAIDPGTRFHPPTFLLRHSATAYGRRLECANCHDARVFCRDCHTQSGISTVGGTGRLRSAFHDAEPLWLLRHARAARQGLESCTTCHSQRDCLQCHSELGAFRVNPHGDDFDPRRAQKRNPVICFACHVTDPLTGRT